MEILGWFFLLLVLILSDLRHRYVSSHNRSQWQNTRRLVNVLPNLLITSDEDHFQLLSPREKEPFDQLKKQVIPNMKSVDKHGKHINQSFRVFFSFLRIQITLHVTEKDIIPVQLITHPSTPGVSSVVLQKGGMSHKGNHGWWLGLITWDV